jgi:nicotinamide-nucleotide amidase
MKTEIITIGDELLIGQIVNTNAAHIGRELSSVGIPVTRETTVGDNMKSILATFRRAWKESDVIIVTGGLGPTHDDISKTAVARFFRKELVMHKPTLVAVKARFAKLGYTKMPDVNIGQALVPEDFRILKNERGTAPGLLYHHGGKTFAIVAGVPQEMEYVLGTGIIPFLRKTYRNKLERILHRTLMTTGIGESMLVEKIGDPKGFLGKNTTLAFLPNAGGVRLRISTHAKTERVAQKEIDRIESILRERAGKYVYGADDESLESHIVRLLKNRKKTLSTAESCTGGLVATKVTEIAGSSSVFFGAVVAYDNRVKIKQLGVKSGTLERYGAVSEQTCIEMAEGALSRLQTDYALSVTGIAGPDGGTREKPVGTIWVGLAEQGQKTIAKKLQLDFGRTINRERSANAALNMLLIRLRDGR